MNEFRIQILQSAISVLTGRANRRAEYWAARPAEYASLMAKIQSLEAELAELREKSKVED